MIDLLLYWATDIDSRKEEMIASMLSDLQTLELDGLVRKLAQIDNVNFRVSSALSCLIMKESNRRR